MTKWFKDVPLRNCISCIYYCADQLLVNFCYITNNYIIIYDKNVTYGSAHVTKCDITTLYKRHAVIVTRFLCNGPFLQGLQILNFGGFWGLQMLWTSNLGLKQVLSLMPNLHKAHKGHKQLQSLCIYLQIPSTKHCGL